MAIIAGEDRTGHGSPHYIVIGAPVTRSRLTDCVGGMSDDNIDTAFAEPPEALSWDQGQMADLITGIFLIRKAIEELAETWQRMDCTNCSSLCETCMADPL